MTKRDEFIIRKQERANAFRDAARLVPADATDRGTNVREMFVSCARSLDAEVEMAEAMSTREFLHYLYQS